MSNSTIRGIFLWILALVGIVSRLSGLPTTDAFVPPIDAFISPNPKSCADSFCRPQFTLNGKHSENIHARTIRSKDTSKHAGRHNDIDFPIRELSKKSFDSAIGKSLDELTSFANTLGTNIKIVPVAVAAFLAISASMTNVQPANAVLGAGGAVVTSPSIIKDITLQDFLKLSPKKQRQYEGGFLSCRYDNIIAPEIITQKGFFKGTKTPFKRKICQPTNVIDELLKEIDALAETNPDRADEYKALASNIVQRQRFLDRQSIEASLGKQPAPVYFTCALLAACVATSIMHPIDTLKVRLMSGKVGEAEDGDEELEDGKNEDITSVLTSLADLYDGLLPNLLKEGPASALYLGIYEYSRTILEGLPFLEGKVLLIYLLAGSIGELAGSVVRSPAEAVKTRVQAGLYDAPGAVENVFFTDEGRKNTFSAWSAGVFRDVPHGAVLIATFELTKTLIVESPYDIDVNTLLAEALIGGLGGGLGALISTPSDVVTTKIITSIESGGDAPSPLDILSETWNEGGVKGLFSGVTERIGYWTLSYGIFLSVYCSLRQYALAVMK